MKRGVCSDCSNPIAGPLKYYNRPWTLCRSCMSRVLRDIASIEKEGGTVEDIFGE